MVYKLSNEEYKKQLIRMWDSLRTVYKGEDKCDGVVCDECPLNGCEVDDMYELPYTYERANSIVARWSYEHPQKTNEEKFKELFPDFPLPTFPKEYSVKHQCQHYAEVGNCNGCNTQIIKDWWNQEYTGGK